MSEYPSEPTFRHKETGNVRLHAIFTITSLILMTPLMAQVEEPVREGSARKLKFVTEAQTSNYIAKFDGIGAGTVSNSILYEINGNVGIGTTAPHHKLHVHGHVGLENLDLTSYVGLRLNSAGGSQGGGLWAMGTNYTAQPNTANDAGTLALMAYEAGGLSLTASNATTGNIRMYTSGSGAGSERLRITHAGNVGIGTATPQHKLHVYGHLGLENPDMTSLVGLRLNSAGGNQGGALWAMGTNYTAQPNTANDAGTVALMAFETGGLSLTAANATNGNIRMYTSGSGPGSERMRITQAGNVGIGIAAPTVKLHVNGSIIATGSITGATVLGAVYQDLAEWVPASSDMAPGTVVVLNLEKRNEVMPSARSYDTAVAGVVSASPGIILGVGGDTKEQIATTGRVKVRVDARAASVRVGDLLVTSDIAGTAMRSTPMDVNGRQFHQPGTIIGKALEPLDDGVAEILVLLSMQ
jgi:hypothetical protein